MGAAANSAGSEGTTGSLFRAESLRAHQQTWPGEIHIAAPPRRWIVIGVALLFTGAIVAYLFLGQHTRRETVPGTRVPAAGLIKLSALQSGLVFTLAIIDKVLADGDYDLLTMLGMDFVLMLLLLAAVSALRSWTVMRFVTSLHLSWAGNVFSHLLRLPEEYIGKRHLGDTVSRFQAVHAIHPSSAVRGLIFVFWRAGIVVAQGVAWAKRGNAVVSRIVCNV